MGLFSKLFKGPEVDKAKSDSNRGKMRTFFNQVVKDGDSYKLVAGYTEDVSRFNYGLVHGSKSKIGSLLVGWNEQSETVVVVPTVPDLSGCGDPVYYRRSEIHKAYRNKYPTDESHRIPRPEGLHRHQHFRLAGGREPLRIRRPGDGGQGVHRLLHEQI